MRSNFFIAFLAILSVSARGQDTPAGIPRAPGEIVSQLSARVEAATPLVKSDWVKSWMATLAKLPPIEARTIQVGDREIVADEELFYTTRYGTPLAYARAFDLACEHGFQPGLGTRVLDFGYGGIGHLRMLALTGCDAHGVDISPLLKALYADASGPLGSGQVRIFDGRFPAEAELVDKIGANFDLVISKNTLKRGYIHPSRELPDIKMSIQLGVSDATFLDHIRRILRPGGMFLIYNLCPPKSSPEEPYVPWAEGESPFTRDQFAEAGLEVVCFDVQDDAMARAFGQALGWDEDMDLEKDLFAWYTIVNRDL
jgi:SAM-dependent methyltransferase